MNVQDAMQSIDRAQDEIAQVFAGSTAWQIPWEMLGLISFGSAILAGAAVYATKKPGMGSSLVGAIACCVSVPAVAIGYGYYAAKPFDRLHERVEQAQAIRDTFAVAGGCDAIIPAIRNGTIVRLDAEQDGFVRAACGELVADAAHVEVR